MRHGADSPTTIPALRSATIAVPHDGPAFRARVALDVGDPIDLVLDRENAVCLCDNLMRRLRDVYGLEAVCLVLEPLVAALPAKAAGGCAA